MVQAPYRTQDFLARLVRVPRGNAQMRAQPASSRSACDRRTSGRGYVTWSTPSRDSSPLAVPHLAITLAAAFLGHPSPAEVLD